MNDNSKNGTNNTNKDNAQNEWRSREIGALWKRESKASGKKYLAGHVKVNELGTEVLLKVVVFPNATKKNEKSPDFVVYVSKDSDDRVTKAPAPAAAKVTPKASAVASSQDDADDVL